MAATEPLACRPRRAPKIRSPSRSAAKGGCVQSPGTRDTVSKWPSKRTPGGVAASRELTEHEWCRRVLDGVLLDPHSGVAKSICHPAVRRGLFTNDAALANQFGQELGAALLG